MQGQKEDEESEEDEEAEEDDDEDWEEDEEDQGDEDEEETEEEEENLGHCTCSSSSSPLLCLHLFQHHNLRLSPPSVSAWLIWDWVIVPSFKSPPVFFSPEKLLSFVFVFFFCLF